MGQEILGTRTLRFEIWVQNKYATHSKGVRNECIKGAEHEAQLSSISEVQL